MFFGFFLCVLASLRFVLFLSPSTEKAKDTSGNSCGRRNEDLISHEIIRLGIEVHRTLGGPGLLECVYEEALAWELGQAGYEVRRQVECPIVYKGCRLATPLRIDLVVNDCVIVECKATSQYNPIFESQVLTYLRLTNRRLGLMLNFGERALRDGIRRVVNGL